MVGIGGIAGVSIKGRVALKRLADETGGRAFFPWRLEDLTEIYDSLAVDVQTRYLLSYTPSNQAHDGKWREIEVTTAAGDTVVQTRKGYFATMPPPIRPTIEFTLMDSEQKYFDVTADDLVVFEDGVEQKLDSFQEAVAPVSVILALDSSGSMRTAAQLAVDAAKGFVAALRPKDALGVLLFADRSTLMHDLSTVREPAIEAIGQYIDELSYFERWIASIANLLVEKGVVGVQELGEAWPRPRRAMPRLAAHEPALRRWQPGAREGTLPAGALPDAVLHPQPGRDGPGRGRPSAQPGGAGLRPDRSAAACGLPGPLSACRALARRRGETRRRGGGGPARALAGARGRKRTVTDHDHDHPHRRDLEDAPLTWHMALTEGVAAPLQAKGVFSAEELRRALEMVDSRSPADGARLVARAWVDPEFRARVLQDVNAAALELGIDAVGIPIRAVANDATTHNVIVCTLCSCYPRLLLGPSPDWYKARAYRSRVVREPRAVLAEFGLELPAEVTVVVHDSTAELRYLVLPERPAGTEGWSEAELAAIVTRDCLIGTAVPRAGG